MTAVIGLMPEWFLLRYMRGETSLGVSFLALVQWTVKLVLWPVKLTWEALLEVDTLAYELMAVGTEFLFLVWLLFGYGFPHEKLMAMMPLRWWILLGTALFVDHLWQLRSRDRDMRAMALMFDVIGYAWLLLTVFTKHFYFAEIFLSVFATMGVVAVLSLQRAPCGGAHGDE